MKKRYLKSMKRWIGWILSATVIATSGNVPAVVWAEEFSSGVDNETNLLEEREANENIISDEENRDDILDQEIESETLFSDADTDSDGTEAEILEEDTLVFSAGQCSKSRQDAVNWAYAQDGKFLDYDKAYGTQCVDLIKYYYQVIPERKKISFRPSRKWGLPASSSGKLERYRLPITVNGIGGIP